MQTRPLHLCSISCSLLTRTRMLREKNSNINYTDVKLMLKHPYFSARGASGTGHVHAESLHAYDWLFTTREIQTQPPRSQVLSPFPPLSRRRQGKEREPKMVVENSTEISKSTASLWSVEYLAHREFTWPTLSRKYSRRPHYIGEIRKSSFISTVRPPVTLTDPSRKRSFPKRSSNWGEFENTGFSLSCGQKI